jgi:hypothetical protein
VGGGGGGGRAAAVMAAESPMVSLACCCSPLEQPTTRTAAQQKKTRWRTLTSAVKGISTSLPVEDGRRLPSISPAPCSGDHAGQRLLSIGVEGSYAEYGTAPDRRSESAWGRPRFGGRPPSEAPAQSTGPSGVARTRSRSRLAACPSSTRPSLVALPIRWAVRSVCPYVLP